ncbi:hypothetical protein T440DRAFT_547106 [Plenodomus tracheiphilus IPT5]|uniref:WLM domain-containing protein n=1 Tax=Plenodomus tracheiphilus IPT5 TaxID=1408161 RepID=A0A6A7ANF2_9PLEO|nr:hypothetical protein T440DRAFT_547106 [Plenodomus tracheiphilus IPT5]
MDHLEMYDSYHHRDEIAIARGMDGEFGMYKTIHGFPLEPKALSRLRRCAFIVAPIMRRHGWQMPILAELHPSDSCLGKSYFIRRTYHGKFRNEVTLIPREMRLRLRRPYDPATLISMKELIRTVLHELAHFSHRSHFFSFYRFNATLLAELDYDVREGCHRKKVGRSEIPPQIASREEMRDTMIRDAGNKIISCLLPQRTRTVRQRSNSIG